MTGFTCNLRALYCAFENTILKRGLYCLWNALRTPPLSVALSCHWPRNFPVTVQETFSPAGGSPLSQCPKGL